MNARWYVTLAPFLLLLPAPARADTLYPGSNSAGVITLLSRGVKEIGIESILVVGYDKAGDVSTLRASALAGPTFRYFVANNVSLALNGSVLYKTSSTSGTPGQSDIGGLGTLTVGYYASLGGGMFIEPLLGVGGFYARRTVGDDPGAIRSDIYGGTGRVGLELVFYPSSRFSLRAGPEAVASFGKSSSTAQAVGATFVSVDAGFGVGLSYVF
jgi:hypothetical protein